MLLRIAFRNVIVHWRQSLAALLSISGAFFCFVFFQGYIKDVQRLYVDANRSRVMYGDALFENRDFMEAAGRRDPWTYSLHADEQKIIVEILRRHESEINQAVRHLYFQGMITAGGASKVFIGRATDLAEAANMRAQWRWNAVYGKPLHESKAEHPILLGQGLAWQLGCQPGPKKKRVLADGGYVAEDRPFICPRDDVQLSVTTGSGNLNAMDFTISGIVDGIYKDLDARYVEVPLDVAQQLLNSQDISFWAVKLKPGIDPPTWIQKINLEMSKDAPSLHAISWMDHPVGDLYRKSMSLLNLFGNFVSIVVAFISILSVMNTMVKIVTERTREIGTLLSLGFQRGQILLLFLQEAFFLGLIGSALGALVALIATHVVNSLGITYKAGLFSDAVPFRIAVAPTCYGVALVTLILVTLFTCYTVCRSTVHKKIVECLGHI